MESYFPAAFFSQNRRQLRTLFSGTAPIVLTANGLLQRNQDVTYPFRQDSNFWYLTDLNEADFILVMDKDKEYLILPEQHEIHAMFDGAHDIEKIKQQSGIEQVFDTKAGWKQLTARLKRVKHVATLAAPLPYIKHYNMYTNPARAALINKIKTINPTVELLDLKEHVTTMRVIKQPAELAAIEKAIAITSQALKKVAKKLPRYRNEAEIEADISHSFRYQGATGHAFEPIVASGSNATTLHYQANNAVLTKNGFIVIDIGAEVSNYAADITRTYSYGRPSRRQQAVYKAVLEVHAFALERLKPGVVNRVYEEEVEHYMGEKLRELGLIKSIEKDQVRKYYPQLTSHFLGLDTHDIGNYDQPMQANMVLTVEPGIYIPEEGIGIRIEDDVLITPTGNKILSNKLPRDLS